MKEKTITKAEFKEAVKKVFNKMTDDPDLDGTGKLIAPILGMSFAAKMETILFDEEKEDKKND